MCNLYSMTASADAIRRLFRVTGGATPNLPAVERIRPTATVPVVRRDESGERVLASMRWGFILQQGDAAPKPVTNARSDKVAISSFWKGSFESRRCLVPATAFGEWTDTAPKILHWFRPQEAGEDGLFAFAGIWRSWKGVLKGEQVSLETMAFLTTSPNADVLPIHSKSMPVILGPDQFSVWMEGAPEEALSLAKPLPDGSLAVERDGKPGVLI